jgi:hypothetical protein
LWKEWSDAGSQGECPKCNHTHLLKTWIHPDHWAPRVLIQNTYRDDNGESYVVNTSLHADKKHMKLVVVPSFSGKTTKEALEFAHSGMSMPLIVPEFRTFISRCLWSRTFVAPPILEESIKPGVLFGRLRDEYDALMADIDMLERDGDPAADNLRSRVDELESQRRKYDVRMFTLHIFIPMNPALFRVSVLPSGFTKMGLGLHVLNRYHENQEGLWVHESEKLTQY